MIKHCWKKVKSCCHWDPSWKIWITSWIKLRQPIAIPTVVLTPIFASSEPSSCTIHSRIQQAFRICFLLEVSSLLLSRMMIVIMWTRWSPNHLHRNDPRKRKSRSAFPSRRWIWKTRSKMLHSYANRKHKLLKRKITAVPSSSKCSATCPVPRSPRPTRSSFVANSIP
jgi:hypothetical protein